MKNRFWIVLWFVAFVLPFSAFSQENTQSSHPFLWKATSGSSTLWLFGTIHIGADDMFPLDPRVEKAISASRIGVVEVSPEEIDNLSSVMQSNRDKIFMPEGKSSLDLLTEENKAKVEALVGKDVWAGLGTSQPWVVGMYLTSIQANKMGYANQKSVDQYVIDRFTEQKKKMVGLETAQFQLEVLSSATLELQAKMLNDDLAHFDEQNSYLEALLQAYRKGDEPAIIEIFEKSQPNETLEEKNYIEAILDRRNVGMTESIGQFLGVKNSAYFVAVGCAHLLGPKGIPELLRQKGFTVERVE